MPRRIAWTPQAKSDLREIAVSLAGRSVSAGMRFLDAVEADLQKLARNPGLGSAYELHSPHLAGIRYWRVRGFENYLLFYRPVKAGIEFVRILHGARDIETALAEEQAPES